MESQSYKSLVGPTGRVVLENEHYLIVMRGDQRIDISFKTGIIRIYSGAPFRVHDMNRIFQDDTFRCRAKRI